MVQNTGHYFIIRVCVIIALFALIYTETDSKLKKLSVYLAQCWFWVFLAHQTVPVKKMKADDISSLLDSLGFYKRSQKGEEVPEEFQQFPLRAPRDELWWHLAAKLYHCILTLYNDEWGPKTERSGPTLRTRWTGSSEQCRSRFGVSGYLLNLIMIIIKKAEKPQRS